MAKYKYKDENGARYNSCIHIFNLAVYCDVHGNKVIRELYKIRAFSTWWTDDNAGRYARRYADGWYADGWYADGRYAYRRHAGYEWYGDDDAADNDDAST